MQFLLIVKTILSLLPLVIQTIDILEAAFPVTGKGAEKLGLLKGVLQDSVTVASDMDHGQFAQAWPIIEKTVSTIVSMKKQ
jgi:hypothetical protein